MWEIAENLHRVDLTKEERDKHIRRYAELLKEKKTQQEVSSKLKETPTVNVGGRPRKTDAIDIAKDTGLSENTVRRALNPQPSTVPKDEADNQERVYDNLCKWWRRGTRVPQRRPELGAAGGRI